MPTKTFQKDKGYPESYILMTIVERHAEAVYRLLEGDSEYQIRMCETLCSPTADYSYMVPVLGKALLRPFATCSSVESR